jgi:hypothetical protein
MICNCKTFNWFFCLLFLSAALVACEQDENVTPTSDTMDSVSEFLLNDNGLRITRLTDDEDDETYYFDAYLFVFRTDGTVRASNSSTTVDGTYSVFRDDGRIELQMDFPDIQNFDELDDDWYFISINQNTIRFDDDGDILEFQQQ